MGPGGSLGDALAGSPGRPSHQGRVAGERARTTVRREHHPSRPRAGSQHGRQLQRYERQQAEHHPERPYRQGHGPHPAPHIGLRCSHREFQFPGVEELGPRLRGALQATARYRVRIHVRVRPHRAPPPLQDVRAGGAGDLGIDLPLRAAEPAARRVGVVVPRRYRRPVRRHGRVDGHLSPQRNRRGAAHRPVPDDRRHHAQRAVDPGPHRERAVLAA